MLSGNKSKNQKTLINKPLEIQMQTLESDAFGKFNGNELDYLKQLFDGDMPSKEALSWAQEFEQIFAKKMDVKYAIACNSGTSGLHAAVVAAGIKPGDEVISPGLTVIMDAFAIIHAGGTPVFADVLEDTQNIDPIDIEKKITNKTKAIIVVSLQGLPVDMDPIMEIARKNNIVVIEDSAQTMLGTYNDKYAGTIGDIGVFSFENKKHITSGSEGGMIVTNNEELAIKVRKFAGIGYKHLSATAGRTSLAMATVQDPSYQRFDTIGLNYRMNEISAAVGLAQFERAEFIVNRRKKVADLYREAIDNCDWIIEQKIPKNSQHSHYTFSAQYFAERNNGVTWKDFYNKYVEMGGDGFYAACQVPYLEPVFNNLSINGIKYSKGICPVAEAIQPRIMQFKTNYRNIDEAKKKAEILNNLVAIY